MPQVKPYANSECKAKRYQRHRGCRQDAPVEKSCSGAEGGRFFWCRTCPSHSLKVVIARLNCRSSPVYTAYYESKAFPAMKKPHLVVPVSEAALEAHVPPCDSFRF